MGWGVRIFKKGSNNKICFLLILIISIIFSFNTVFAADEAIYVNGSSGLDTNDGYSWSTPKLTIQNATNTVQNGGTVTIADGTYSGPGNSNITIIKNMTITGQSQRDTIINGSNTNWMFKVNSDVYLTLLNLTFTNGNSSAGGAIFNNGTLNATHCTFTNNNASYGGAIAAITMYTGNINTIVSNCAFLGNQATDGGAIVSMNFLGGLVNCIVTDCTFTNNNASNGGAIMSAQYGSVPAILNVFNSNFTSNHGPQSGALSLMGNCTIQGCNFTANTGKNGAALGYFAMSISEDTFCNISDCNFTDNIATEPSSGALASYIGGGAVLNQNGKLNINNSNFNLNSITGTNTYGGAVCNVEGTLTATNCTFYKNEAQFGGAICNLGGITWYPATSTINECSFNNNSATNGGALANYLFLPMMGQGSGVVTSTVSFCNFNNNSAIDGGAIFNVADLFTTGSVNLNLNNSNFLNNSADYGGAILSTCYLSTGSVNCNINQSNFDSNTAQGFGGALYSFSNTGQNICNLQTSNFIYNTATYGGAILNNVFNGTTNVNFCRFFGNSGDGAAINNYFGSFNATNNWWGNNTDPKTIPNLIAGVSMDNVNSTPWIILSFTVTPDLIGTGEITAAQANLNHNSNSENIWATYGKSLPPVGASFTSDSLGSFNPVNGFITGGNNLESAYTAGNTPGFSTVNATVDQQTLTRTVRIMNRDDVYVATTGSDNTGNGSPTAPFLTLYKAVNEVRANGRIHVANGVYTGIYNTGLSINKNMTIMGESQSGTILNGSNTYSFLGVWPGITLYLQDFTITNCYTTGWAGAIYNSGRLYVERCTFSYNYANRGAAIYNWGGGSIYPYLFIGDCTFFQNEAQLGGAVCSFYSQIYSTDSHFYNNTGYTGGAFYVDTGTLQVYDCLFENNTAINGAGAIYTGFYSSIGSCAFINNTGGWGGAIWNAGGNDVYLCSFYLNNASVGTALYNSYNLDIVKAYNNWWATNSDPKTILNLIDGPARDNVYADPWIVLKVSVMTNTIHILESSTITANLSENSNDQHLWDYYHNGLLPVRADFYSDGWGTLNPLWSIIPKGRTIYSTFTAGTTPGIALVGATVQGYTSTMPLTITMYTNLTVNNVTGNPGETVILESTLKDNLGNSLVGKNIEFYIAGVKVGENVTDTNGTATFNYVISQLGGNFTINTIFPGDSQYLTSNATGYLYVPQANLYLTITSNKNNPRVGQIFTLTYKLGNKGPDPAKNVTITINLPSGFVVTSITGDGNWNYNPTTRTITWTLAQVPVGDPYLYLSGRLLQPGTYVFSSSISSATYNINTIGANSFIIHAGQSVRAVGMQNTGQPLIPLILAGLMIFIGLVVPYKKK